jgi:cytochrome c556
MKIRTLLGLLALVITVAPSLSAQDTPAAPKAAPAKEDQTELGGKMEKIGGAFRKLRKQVADATKNDDSLAQVAIIRDNATAALKLKPAKAADLPAADQDKFVADFQAKIQVLLDEVDKLEAALKANDNDTAGKVLASMGMTEREGHKEFRKPESK